MALRCRHLSGFDRYHNLHRLNWAPDINLPDVSYPVVPQIAATAALRADSSPDEDVATLVFSGGSSIAE